MTCSALGLVTVFVLLSCSGGAPPEDRISVTASIFPLADIARQVGGGRVTVEVLIPPGASPHIFEPPPDAFRRFSRTQLFVMVGGGLEFWAEKLIEATAGDDLVVLRAADGMTLVQTGRHRHGEGNGRHDEAPQDRGGNPHVWLDPLVVSSLAERIAAALEGLDPDHAAGYRSRLADCRDRLTALDQNIARTVNGFEIKEYVSFHPSWTYFARRYGLHELGVIQQSPGRDPTPRQVQALIDSIRGRGVTAVFAEPQFNPAAARAIAREAGVRVLILDPLGGPDMAGRDDYIALMNYNVNIMSEAMR
jgi:zinc transport system substrate-binding protein